MSQPKIQFGLDARQYREFLAWESAQDKKVAERQNSRFARYGAIGGAYEFTFCPTGLGTIVKIRNSVTGDVLDLSHDEEW